MVATSAVPVLLLVAALLAPAPANPAPADPPPETPSPAATPPPACPTAATVQELARRVLDPTLDIGRIRPTGINELCEVEVLLRGDRLIFYTDRHASVALLGPMVNLRSGQNLTQDAILELSRFSSDELEALDTLAAFSLGSGEKRVLFVADPHCPHCKRAEKGLEELAAEGAITARFVLFPLSDATRPQCVAVLCDGKGYEEFAADYTSENQCEEGAARLDAGIAILRKHSISRTPTYILADGAVHIGALTTAELRDALGLPQPPAADREETGEEGPVKATAPPEGGGPERR